MWLFNLSWRIKLMLMFVTIGMAQEDTLQSALNAVHRRQRDLTEIPDYYPENRPGRYYYLPSDKDDLAFLKSDNRLNHYNGTSNSIVLKLYRVIHKICFCIICSSRG